MKFYHCFPGPSSGADDAGIAALRCMIEFGMLLTPETLEIPANSRSSSPFSKLTEHEQQRACFTLMARDELDVRPEPDVKSHSEQFGRFAIGGDPVAMRRLGMVPVMYFYRSQDGENISHEILFRLRELRVLMNSLARIEARGLRKDRDWRDQDWLDRWGYQLEGEPDALLAIAGADRRLIRHVTDMLDTDRVGAWNLVDWIDIILNFFQTADSNVSDTSLQYYRQREWRLVRLYGDHVRCLPLDREVAYREKGREGVMEADRALRAIEPNFPSAERLRSSFLFQGTDGNDFFDFIDEVIVPADAQADAERLLFPIGFRTGPTDLAGRVFFQRAAPARRAPARRMDG